MSKIKQRRKFSALYLIIGIILVLSTAFMFLLFLMAFNTSLKSDYDLGIGNSKPWNLPNMRWWSKPWEVEYPNNIFANYLSAFKYLKVDKPGSGYYAGLFNKTSVNVQIVGNLLSSSCYSILYALVSALVAAFVPMFMGYLCAKYQNKASAFIYAMVLFVMATPIVGSQPSLVNLMRSLRLYDTFIGNWLTKASFTNMYFLIYYAYFRGLSSSFDEAAEIDGASQLAVMFKICMPLASSIFWTIVLMLFVAFWNDYTTPMLLLPSKPTLSYLVYYKTTYDPSVAGENGSTIFTFQTAGRKMAVLMVFAIPIIAIFAIFNKQLMSNLTMGGVKE